MKKLVAIAAFVLASAPVWALSYQIGGGSVSAYNGSNGLEIETQVLALPTTPFSLNDGESLTFNFFNIWTDEGTVNLGEDTTAREIKATLNFVTPDVDATIKGITIGVWGFYQFGAVVWGDPAVFTLADRVFKVALSDEIFNSGMWFGLDEGACNGAVVQATVTQVSHVPDGGVTVALLGAALLGLVAVRRRVA